LISYFISDEILPNSGQWVAPIRLPANDEKFEWKWVVIDQKNATVVRWEERSNRETVLWRNISHCLCYAAWNYDVVYGTLSEYPST
jgi:hypothetical protein